MAEYPFGFSPDMSGFHFKFDGVLCERARTTGVYGCVCRGFAAGFGTAFLDLFGLLLAGVSVRDRACVRELFAIPPALAATVCPGVVSRTFVPPCGCRASIGFFNFLWDLL
jgi:hypothetical protein